MTNEQIKDAMLSEEPVEFNGIEYRCIQGIIYRRHPRKKDAIKIQVELMDKHKNCIVIADPRKVKSLKKIETEVSHERDTSESN